jgi:hypothetical protein
LKRIITLTTDFGTQDGYAGAIKGVILGINPKVKIVDISHQIPAQNILAGAFCLYNSASLFPNGTIHVAVVDPGVGSKRKAILIQTERHYLIGPDNGIFGLLLRKDKVKKVIELRNLKHFFGKISPTFHGRDIFAPVAAYLSLGVKPEEFGPESSGLRKLTLPRIKKSKAKIIGQIIHIDNFGNLVSNVTAQDLGPVKKMSVSIKAHTLTKLSRTFAQVKRGELLAYIGSADFLELGLREGSACLKLKARIGDKVEI